MDDDPIYWRQVERFLAEYYRRRGVRGVMDSNMRYFNIVVNEFIDMVSSDDIVRYRLALGYNLSRGVRLPQEAKRRFRDLVFLAWFILGITIEV